MPSLQISITDAERDLLYLANIPVIVLRYNDYFNKYRKHPTLGWYRRQLVYTESVPDFCTFQWDIDHILPKKITGPLNHPNNLMILPSGMNKSFSKFVNKEKVAFVGNTIFNAATDFLKQTLDNKQEPNPFGMYSY